MPTTHTRVRTNKNSRIHANTCKIKYITSIRKLYPIPHKRLSDDSRKIGYECLESGRLLRLVTTFDDGWHWFAMLSTAVQCIFKVIDISFTKIRVAIPKKIHYHTSGVTCLFGDLFQMRISSWPRPKHWITTCLKYQEKRRSNEQTKNIHLSLLSLYFFPLSPLLISHFPLFNEFYSFFFSSQILFLFSDSFSVPL